MDVVLPLLAEALWVLVLAWRWPTRCRGWVTLPGERRGCAVPSAGAVLREWMEMNVSGPETEKEETPFTNVACSLPKG